MNNLRNHNAKKYSCQVQNIYLVFLLNIKYQTKYKTQNFIQLQNCKQNKKRKAKNLIIFFKFNFGKQNFGFFNFNFA